MRRYFVQLLPMPGPDGQLHEAILDSFIASQVDYKQLSENYTWIQFLDDGGATIAAVPANMTRSISSEPILGPIV